ncbi:hypothetical protein AB0M22_19185 [Nocardia sp. NPDC051756]|uniref:hypothetical protein n=1 Tax=Nocardia sp. NPDC051756 TaxID=3154751 RepID=UPI0034161DB6
MTALIGRRVAAVLSGTALTAALIAGMAGAASAQPGPPPMPTQPGPYLAIDPVPGELIECPEIGPDGSVVITHGEGEQGPWVTIERGDLPPGAVPATPLDAVPSAPALTYPGVPADEPGCVVASVR